MSYQKRAGSAGIVKTRPGAAQGTSPSRAAPADVASAQKVSMRRGQGDKIGMRFGKELVDGRFLVLEEVASDSLAARHGLKAGDVIEQINGMKHASAIDAVKALREAHGDIDLIVSPRNRAAGEAMQRERPRAEQFSIPPPRAGDANTVFMHKGQGDSLGMQFKKDLVDGKYLVLENVAPDSLAAKHGLKKGDMIERINGAQHASPFDAVKALREAQGEIDLVMSPRNRAAGEEMQRASSFKRRGGAQPSRPPLGHGAPRAASTLQLHKSEGDKLGIRFGEQLVDGKFLLVEEVAPGSLAASKGLVAGDLIEAVNGLKDLDPLKAAEKLRSTRGEIELLVSPRSRPAGAGAAAYGRQQANGGAAPLRPLGGPLVPAEGAGAGAGAGPRPAGMAPLALGGLSGAGGGGSSGGEVVVLKKREGERIGLRFAEKRAGQSSPFLTVLEVLHGSLADKATLKVGDKVRSVNGVSGLTAARAMELMRDARSEITIVIAERAKEGEALPVGLTPRAQPRGAAAAHAASSSAAAGTGGATPRGSGAAAEAANASAESDSSFFGLGGLVRRMSWTSTAAQGAPLATLPTDEAATPRAAPGASTPRGPGGATPRGNGAGGGERREKRPSMFTNFLIRLDPNKLRAIIKLQSLVRGFLDRLAARRLRQEHEVAREYRARIRRQRQEEVAAYTIQTGFYGYQGRARARRAREEREARQRAAAAAKAREGGIGGLIRRASFKRGDQRAADKADGPQHGAKGRTSGNDVHDPTGGSFNGRSSSRPAYNGVSPSRGVPPGAGAGARHVHGALPATGEREPYWGYSSARGASGGGARGAREPEDDMAAAVRKASLSGGVAEEPQAKVGKPSWLDRAVQKGEGANGGGGGSGGGLIGGLARRLSWRANDASKEKEKEEAKQRAQVAAQRYNVKPSDLGKASPAKQPQVGYRPRA